MNLGTTSRWIHDWNPDDETFWAERGRAVARRNLIWSVFTQHLGFSVWLLWSVVAVRLNDAGFAFSTGQLFTLVAVPNLVGATMRFPYTVAGATGRWSARSCCSYRCSR